MKEKKDDLGRVKPYGKKIIRTDKLLRGIARVLDSKCTLLFFGAKLCFCALNLHKAEISETHVGAETATDDHAEQDHDLLPSGLALVLQGLLGVVGGAGRVLHRALHVRIDPAKCDVDQNNNQRFIRVEGKFQIQNFGFYILGHETKMVNIFGLDGLDNMTHNHRKY